MGFLAPESLRPDPRLAVRGVLGLMAPILLGRALDLPALDVAGIAAFLLTFGDTAGSEEPGQLARLALGIALGAGASASGVLAGSHTVTAVAGMLAWGAAVGLLGAYGNAGAGMALPVAWAYFELGLTAPSHTPWHACLMAALYIGGGVWTTILAAAINAIGPYGPLRERTADCYAALAVYLDDALRIRAYKPASNALSPETPVREAIATARWVAVQARQGQQATSDIGQRLVALIELADQLFSLGAALGDSQIVSASDAVLIEAVHGIRAAIASRAKAGALVNRLECLVGQEPDDDAGRLRGRIAGVLLSALHLAAGDGAAAVAALDGARARRDRWRLIEPLRTCLTWDSVVLRHAVRFGLLTAAAVAVQRLWHPPFGHWIPLTVSVVLKPYAGATLTRGAQRLTGTVAGVVVGLAISAMTIGVWAAQAAAAAVAFFLLLAVLPINYGWAVLFLTAGVIPLEMMLTGSGGWHAGLFRIVNTGVGGGMARTVQGSALRPVAVARVGQEILMLHAASARLIAQDGRIIAAPGRGEAGPPSAGTGATSRGQAPA